MQKASRQEEGVSSAPSPIRYVIKRIVFQELIKIFEEESMQCFAPDTVPGAMSMVVDTCMGQLGCWDTDDQFSHSCRATVPPLHPPLRVTIRSQQKGLMPYIPGAGCDWKEVMSNVHGFQNHFEGQQVCLNFPNMQISRKYPQLKVWSVR